MEENFSSEQPENTSPCEEGSSERAALLSRRRQKLLDSSFVPFDRTSMKPVFDKVEAHLKKHQQKPHSPRSITGLNAIIKDYLDQHQFDKKAFAKYTLASILTTIVNRFPALYESDAGGIGNLLTKLSNYIDNHKNDQKVV